MYPYGPPPLSLFPPAVSLRSMIEVRSYIIHLESCFPVPCCVVVVVVLRCPSTARCFSHLRLAPLFRILELEVDVFRQLVLVTRFSCCSSTYGPRRFFPTLWPFTLSVSSCYVCLFVLFILVELTTMSRKCHLTGRSRHLSPSTVPVLPFSELRCVRTTIMTSPPEYRLSNLPIVSPSSQLLSLQPFAIPPKLLCFFALHAHRIPQIIP
ncbi:hypothetical protein EJ06DRAFT_104579 [Trichodelitschia bisporula]|uniref:Uncharacterized protein n=1 Tax=Trichodelitschia bisporula TaxID=703511 RepID=A0A6G1HR30_9PEZI|nr:hypothetical protein EJ06DRAFT_104579 [Trichodelitschia bisporula]